jgi:hypothetical protein
VDRHGSRLERFTDQELEKIVRASKSYIQSGFQVVDIKVFVESKLEVCVES